MSDSHNRTAKYRRGDLVETTCVSGEARVVETMISYKIAYADGTSFVHPEETLVPYTEFNVDSLVLHDESGMRVWRILAIAPGRGEAWIRPEYVKDDSRVAKLSELTMYRGAGEADA